MKIKKSGTKFEKKKSAKNLGRQKKVGNKYQQPSWYEGSAFAWRA